jgi:hypothetical protein
MDTKTITAKLAEIKKDAALNLEVGDRMGMYENRHAGLTLQEMSAEMKTTGEAIDYLDGLLKYLNAEYDTLRLKLIPDKMDAENIESPFTVTGIGRVVLTADAYITVKPGQAEQLHTWLNERNLGDLIKGTVNPSTLKAFVKGCLQNNKPWPQEIVNVTPFTRASITKPK